MFQTLSRKSHPHQVLLQRVLVARMSVRQHVSWTMLQLPDATSIALVRSYPTTVVQPAMHMCVQGAVQPYARTVCIASKPVRKSKSQKYCSKSI